MSPQEIEALRALIHAVDGVPTDPDTRRAVALRSYLATHQEAIAAFIATTNRTGSSDL